MCKEISKILQGHSNGPWPQKKVASVDKVLGELTRAVEGPNVSLTLFVVLIKDYSTYGITLCA